VIELTASRRPADKELLIHGAPPSDPNVHGSTVVRDADTGEAVMVVARFPADRLGAYRQALLGYPKDTTVRAGGIRNVSRTFGFTSRQALMQRNACRSCSGAMQAPNEHAEIVGAAPLLAELLASYLPERAAADRALVEAAVLPDWRMGAGSWWTSGVVNWTSVLPYHYDRNNFPAWSAMTVVRREVRGGYLHVPEYGLTVECRDGDVVFFNGNDLMHGVTPMQRVRPSAYRVSAVYYPVKRMAMCLPPAEELEHGRRARSAREDDLLTRQRAAGNAPA